MKASEVQTFLNLSEFVPQAYKKEFEAKELHMTLDRIQNGTKQRARVDVEKTDPFFGEKAILAMTVVKAGYPFYEMLDEKQLAAKFGLPPLDFPGFFALDPDGQKIITAIIPDVKPPGDTVGAGHYDRFLAAATDALAHLVVSSDDPFAPATLACRADFEFGALFRQDNQFARSLEAVSDNWNAADSRKNFGCSFETQSLGRPAFTRGFPVLCVAQSFTHAVDPTGQSSSKIKPQTLMTWPLHNPQGSSLYNNARAMAKVDATAEQRREYFSSQIEIWESTQRALNGDIDKELGCLNESEENKDKFRQDHLVRSYSQIGDSKQIGYHSATTKIHTFGNTTVFASTDIAVLDGQHSSRDIGLLTQSMMHDTTPFFHGEPVLDCDPAKLKALFFHKTRTYRADKLKISEEDVDNKEHASKNAKLYQDFVDQTLAHYGPSVSVFGGATAEQAIMRAVIQNNRKVVSEQDMAMARHLADLKIFVGNTHREADAQKDSLFIGLQKNLAGDKYYATDASLVTSFSDIFPFLRVAAQQPHVVDSETTLAQARETVSRNFVGMTSEEKIRLVDQTALFFKVFPSLKSRDFTLNETRLSETLQHLSPLPAVKRFIGAVGRLVEDSAMRFLPHFAKAALSGLKAKNAKNGANDGIYAAIGENDALIIGQGTESYLFSRNALELKQRFDQAKEQIKAIEDRTKVRLFSTQDTFLNAVLLPMSQWVSQNAERGITWASRETHDELGALLDRMVILAENKVVHNSLLDSFRPLAQDCVLRERDSGRHASMAEATAVGYRKAFETLLLNNKEVAAQLLMLCPGGAPDIMSLMESQMFAKKRARAAEASSDHVEPSSLNAPNLGVWRGENGRENDTVQPNEPAKPSAR